MNTYCANFTLVNKDGRVVFEGYSEHVWIDQRALNYYDDAQIDMLHFSLDSMNMPIGEVCQIVADLGGVFEWAEWLDAYVPMQRVQSIAFEH